MRKKRWIKLSLLACLLIAGAFLLLAVFQKETPGTITARDLRDCELYINNFTCSNKFEMRRVEEEEYRDKIAALVTKVAPFRPVLELHDTYYGTANDPYAFFVDDKISYGIYFPESLNQLSLDYIYRDKPVVCVSKTEIDEQGDPHTLWLWYCTMSAADYAALYNPVNLYSRGEIVDRESLKSVDHE